MLSKNWTAHCSATAPRPFRKWMANGILRMLRMQSANIASFAVQWYGDPFTNSGASQSEVKAAQIKAAILMRGLIVHSPNKAPKLAWKLFDLAIATEMSIAKICNTAVITPDCGFQVSDLSHAGNLSRTTLWPKRYQRWSLWGWRVLALDWCTYKERERCTENVINA